MEYETFAPLQEQSLSLKSQIEDIIQSYAESSKLETRGGSSHRGPVS